MRNRLIVAAALLAASVIAHAQELPPGKWWRRPEIVQELAITGEQQERLDEVFRAAADELIDAKAEVEKLQVALRGEIDRSQLRRQEIQRIATRLSDARATLFERELMMLVDMRGVLTNQQWNQMRDRLEQMREHDRGRPGPPRGGPPPRRKPRP
ncbi:MAG TPA: hypothetical protein VF824_20925 [Thermoanaerobaculia bacterium]